MKKRFLLSLFVLTGFYLQAQEVLNEQFNGSFPPTGWSIDAQVSNWSADQSSYAGGTAPEAVMSWNPEFNNTTRLISPALNLSGESTVLLQFKHFVDHYGNSYQIGVATRSNGGAWTNAWTKTVTSNISATTVMVPITDGNVNSSSFQFCLFFSGNSYNINSWSIDDVILSIPGSLDGSVTALNVPTYFTGSTDVKGTIANFGTTPIVSFNVNWQLNDGEIHSDIIVGQNLNLGQTYNFTAQDQLTPEPGVHTLKVWVSTVNGTTTPDNNPLNDTMTKVLRIPTQTLQRVPMFEEFTSSTCSPCATFNNNTFNPFLAQNGEQIVLVKYQMNWPSPGDAYYTPEGGVRRDYYGVNAVPMLYVDGKNVSTSSSALNAAFNAAVNKPAFVDLQAYYSIDGNVISVRGQFISYTDLVNTTLHVIVFEGMTTQNVGTNGETQFHHVMMRILPNGNGTNVQTVQAGVPFTFEQNVNMSNTNVEEMSDLQVAIFLQDNVTKDIFQAAYANLSGVNVINQDLTKLSIYPNPARDVINITIPENLGNTIKVEVINSTGIVVMTEEVSNPNGLLKLSNVFQNGIYTVKAIGKTHQATGKFISIR